VAIIQGAFLCQDGAESINCVSYSSQHNLCYWCYFSEPQTFDYRTVARLSTAIGRSIQQLETIIGLMAMLIGQSLGFVPAERQFRSRSWIMISMMVIAASFCF